jgi:hypothetical protein
MYSHYNKYLYDWYNLPGSPEVNLIVTMLCQLHLAVFKSLVNKQSNVILKPENYHHTTDKKWWIPHNQHPFLSHCSCQWDMHHQNHNGSFLLWEHCPALCNSGPRYHWRRCICIRTMETYTSVIQINSQTLGANPPPLLLMVTYIVHAYFEPL